MGKYPEKHPLIPRHYFTIIGSPKMGRDTSTARLMDTAGRVYLWWIDVPVKCVVNEIIVDLDTTTGNIRLCIYGSDTGDYPDGQRLLAETGSLAAAPSGIRDRSIAETILPKGKYWVGIQSNITTDKFNGPSGLAVSNPLCGIYFNNPGGYGVHPAICPVTTKGYANTPYMALRVARTLE